VVQRLHETKTDIANVGRKCSSRQVCFPSPDLLPLYVNSFHLLHICFPDRQTCFFSCTPLLAASISFLDALASLCSIKCRITTFFPHHNRATSPARFSFLHHMFPAANSTCIRSRRQKSRWARCLWAPSVRDNGKPLPSSKFVVVTHCCVVEPCAPDVRSCAECRFSFVPCSASSSPASWSSPYRAYCDPVVEAWRAPLPYSCKCNEARAWTLYCRVYFATVQISVRLSTHLFIIKNLYWFFRNNLCDIDNIFHTGFAYYTDFCRSVSMLHINFLLSS
jgi:hypothetical protein